MSAVNVAKLELSTDALTLDRQRDQHATEDGADDADGLSRTGVVGVVPVDDDGDDDADDDDGSSCCDEKIVLLHHDHAS